MPLRTTVKVSHISNLSDARYCSGMGVQMLGFSVIPGAEHYLAPNLFQDIRGWIAGPRIVAELYGITSRDAIDAIVRAYAPDHFEMSFDEYKRFSKNLLLPCIVNFPDVKDVSRVLSDDHISHVIVDENTSCDAIDALPFPVLVKVSRPDQLQKILTEGCFKGVVLEGPKEQRPGITNYDQLGVILESLDED